MITKQRQLFYFVGDQPFKTLEEAQLCDLNKIAEGSQDELISKNSTIISRFMLNCSSSIVDILTTTPTSRAKARKTNGGAKKSKRPKLQPANVTES